MTPPEHRRVQQPRRANPTPTPTPNPNLVGERVDALAHEQQVTAELVPAAHLLAELLLVRVRVRLGLGLGLG